MADPLTALTGLAVPTRGSDSGTWDTPVNNNSTAIDGMFGGLQSFSLTNANVTLSVPATFVATPGAGPTQSQNAVVRFTGTLTGNCVITFPRPGIYVVENRCTVGAFYVQLTNGGGGEVIGIPPGKAVDVYSDGTNMRFRNLPDIGSFNDLCGVSAVPAWVGACTVPPWLICDGTVYNISAYPFLGALLAATFGGNGSTTFGVPDLRGRWRIPLDSTGARITAAGCGINGNSLGAAGGSQNHVLTLAELPAFSQTPTFTWTGSAVAQGSFGPALGQGTGGTGQFSITTNSGATTTGAVSAISFGSSAAHAIVIPAQVFGITLIRAG